MRYQVIRLPTWVLLIGLLAPELPAAVVSPATQAPTPVADNYISTRKNVLVLVSAHKTDTWSEAITEGVEEVFATSTDTIGIWTEYMDSVRFTRANAKSVLARLYRRKYSGLKFDVIVTVGKSAVKFAQAHQSGLFQGAPIIFSGLDAEQSRDALSAGAVTGVSEEFRYRDTLDMALRLLPDTTRIILISPDMKNRRVVDQLVPSYRPELDLEIWHDAELAEILQRASRLIPGAIILPLAEPGRLPQYSKSRDRFMDALTAMSPVPIFSVWDVGLGHGILGGYLTQGRYQGVLAGRLAVDLMNGKSFAGVPPAAVRANRLTVDREAMKRFAVKAERLPETARIYPLNTESWRWMRQYFRQIALVFFFLAAISAILLYLLISRHKAQAAQALSEARFRAVFEHQPMSMTLKDLQGRFLLVNPTFEKLHKLDQETVRGKYGHQVFAAKFAAMLKEQDLEVLERNVAVEREHTLRDEDTGEDITLLMVKFPVRDTQGNINAVGTCALNISERKRTLEALVKSELRFQSLYDHAPDIYFTLRGNGDIAAVNKYGAHYLGYDKAELEGTSIIDLTYPQDRAGVSENLARLFEGSNQETESKIDFRLVRKDATWIWVNMRVHVVNDVLDKNPAIRAICRDVSAAHKLSEELSYQASHDALTGLVNRREFELRLKRTVEHRHDSQAQHALCFLDLDQFKIINDTCGHIAGDELLRQMAKVLKKRLRHRDIVARVGGDEFAILMEHCPLQQACLIAEQIRADVEQYRFDWQKQDFSLGVSIGIAVIDANSGSVEDTLKAADSACYLAKDKGRNQIHVYSRNNIEVARHQGEIRWITRLQQALSEDRFELWYQPVVPIGEAVKQHSRPFYEISLRLRDPDQGRVDPAVFMPSAERFGLAGRIDRWVVRGVLDWLATRRDWMDRYALGFINLSAASIADENFAEFVCAQLAQSAVPARHICFEISETVAVTNFVQAEKFIAAFKHRGCRFSLDNFGNRLSSFTHLQRLDVDFLKIDGGIIREVAQDPVNLAIVQSIQHVGGVMGKITIADSIEDRQGLELLTHLGVSFGQGNYLGPPRVLASGESLTSVPDAVSGRAGEKGVAS